MTRTAVALLIAAASLGACSRPPGPGTTPDVSQPVSDAGTAEVSAPPSDAGAEPADASAEEVGEEALPPELAGSDENPVRLFFDEGKSDLKEISFPLLDAVAERLRLRPSEVLRLVGHSDGVEKPGHALELSRERAEAVRRYLEEHGIDTNRFIVDGRGDFEPGGDNTTPEGRASNRRVDFVFERMR